MFHVERPEPGPPLLGDLPPTRLAPLTASFVAGRRPLDPAEQTPRSDLREVLPWGVASDVGRLMPGSRSADWLTQVR